jgi:hypothetical protein
VYGLVLPIPEVKVTFTNTPPNIDGELNDNCWKSANKIGDFVDWQRGKLVRQQTEGYILADDKNLYIGFDCKESIMKELVFKHNEKDGPIWMDDCVEIFIDPKGESKDYYHIAINPKGVVLDEYIDENRTFKKEWDSNIKVKTLSKSDNWIVECAIPFASLNVKTGVSSTWRINLNRERTKKGNTPEEISCWSCTYGGFQNPNRFGKLLGMGDILLNEFCLFAKNKVTNLQVKFTDATKGLECKDDKYKDILKWLNEIDEKFKDIQKTIAELKKGTAQVLEDKLKDLENDLSINLFKNISYYSQIKEINITNPEYAVGFDCNIKKIFKDSPFEGINSLSYTISSAKNEYEGFQIVLLPFTKDLENIRVEISDFKSQNGDILSKENIEPRIVGYVNTTVPPYLSYRVGLWPDILIPFDEERIDKYDDAKKGELFPIWITFYVPKEINSGIYEGKISIKPSNSYTLPLTIKLKVFNFTLPDETHLTTAFDIYPQFFKAGFAHPKKDAEEMKRIYSLFLLKHRISPMFYFDPTTLNFKSDVEFYKKHGMGRFALWCPGMWNGWPKNKRDIDSLLSKYKKFGEICESLGLIDKTYFYADDESAVGDKVILWVSSMLHNANSRFAVMKCAHAMWEPGDHWGDDIDIWCAGIAEYDKKIADKFINNPDDKGPKNEVWIYVSSPSGAPNLAMDFPGITTRILPLMCWKYNITGLLTWVTNYWEGGDPWKNSANYKEQNGQGVLVYPGHNPDRPVASLRLEILRDGMEDYEYLWLLNEKVKKVPSLKKEAEKYLKLEGIISDSGKLHEEDYIHEFNAIYNLRESIANLLEEK